MWEELFGEVGGAGEASGALDRLAHAVGCGFEGVAGREGLLHGGAQAGWR